MVVKELGEALAFSPGHITGFFEICDNSMDLIHKGSCGAGICINQGVITKVKVRPFAQNTVKIRINGKTINSAKVSKEVVNLFLANPYFSNKERVGGFKISVEHEVNIPIGCGLGASGAGALSLALALNKALGDILFSSEAAQIAHIAELKCGTGLGTVLAQTKGGLEIRRKPGAPGLGEVESIPLTAEYRVIVVVLGEIHTEQMLKDSKIRAKINEHGSRALNQFLKQPGIKPFMEISRNFAEAIGLISPPIRKIFDATDKSGFLCSQAMFGKTVFSIVEKSKTRKLIEIFRQCVPNPQLIINVKIDNEGARLL